MKKQFLTFIFSTVLLSLFGQSVTTPSLNNFYAYNPVLDQWVDSIFNSLSDTSRVAQMIITSAGELGKPNSTVLNLAKNNQIGGVVFLKGTKEDHKKLMNDLNTISAANGQLSLLFSIDAEPSLYNGRLKDTAAIPNTNDITTTGQCDTIAKTITNAIRAIGFHQNFAPVVDVSTQNSAIKNRSFGSDTTKVVALSKQFIKTTQALGVVATAKHFPGHGLVKGDTHKKSVYIDGPLQELAMYPPLIKAGVLSVMMAHITIRNNPEYATHGLPASCSRKIVTGLLKEKLGFKGIVITDALNIMKAVTIIDNAPLLASKAGNDMLLMPIDELQTIRAILDEIHKNEGYKEEVYASVKKIIRLKICLGLLNPNTL